MTKENLSSLKEQKKKKTGSLRIDDATLIDIKLATIRKNFLVLLIN